MLQGFKYVGGFMGPRIAALLQFRLLRVRLPLNQGKLEFALSVRLRLANAELGVIVANELHQVMVEFRLAGLSERLPVQVVGQILHDAVVSWLGLFGD